MPREHPLVRAVAALDVARVLPRVAEPNHDEGVIGRAAVSPCPLREQWGGPVAADGEDPVANGQRHAVRDPSIVAKDDRRKPPEPGVVGAEDGAIADPGEASRVPRGPPAAWG